MFNTPTTRDGYVEATRIRSASASEPHTGSVLRHNSGTRAHDSLRAERIHEMLDLLRSSRAYVKQRQARCASHVSRASPWRTRCHRRTSRRRSTPHLTFALPAVGLVAPGRGEEERERAERVPGVATSNSHGAGRRAGRALSVADGHQECAAARWPASVACERPSD